ncbi:MAG: NAD(P)-dependent alcohol dehydrogenase [Parasphingorhabdus sp.]|uniref:NAD(P)-dependent alcohol dehydrogenase n=1 Tax=Parasphingorhabdus sp. TaxID=2709688 RepID=UPI0032639264
MRTVNAFAAKQAGSSLEPLEYELGPLGSDDIDIQVEHCGLCHTDLSLRDNAWGITEFPFVGGHEAIGTVIGAGSEVVHVQIGDRVGLGGHSHYCMTCRQCLDGDHNLCETVQSTVSAGRHGAFADIVRATGVSVVKLPEDLDPKDAGPLFCAGITVFNPFVEYDIKPTARIAVLGIGGLGHLALQLGKAWGCHVTALTSSHSKNDEAKAFGAHDVINSRSPEALAAAAGTFDIILSTIDVALDWNVIIAMLKPKGRLHFLGVQAVPAELHLMPLMFAQLSLSSSLVGSPQRIADMLEFCARHDIKPVTEHFPFAKINEALAHLESGMARYRIVLDQ